jgi:flagellar basal body rod protein FlgG
LRPALPAGPFLPDSIELTAATRAAVAPGHLLLEQARRVVGDNRANVATIGYRRREVLVLRAPTADLQDVDSSTWITRIDLRPGEIISTRNPFDVAIRGAGWFRVQGSESEYFTRCGLLAMDSQRRLCVRTGRGPLPLVPEIVLPADMVLMEIGTGGQVSVRAADDETATISGRIELVDFRAAGQLVWTPAGVFEAGGKSGRPFSLPAEKVEILQRSLEESNVDLRCEAQMLDRLQGVISTGSTP